jgi:hypothetical protein
VELSFAPDPPVPEHAALILNSDLASVRTAGPHNAERKPIDPLGTAENKDRICDVISTSTTLVADFTRQPERLP